VRPRVTAPVVRSRKGVAPPLTMITAYDATFARIVDESGVDMILVGDSVGSVVQGVGTTIPVTIEEMEYHVRLVARANPKALVVGDLPFGSYHVNSEQGVRSAIQLIKAGASAVKLEGGTTMYDTIAAICRVDIPVMGHIGLTPQSYHRMGGHKVQGRDFEGRDRILEDAKSVDAAGAFATVIEGVPTDLAREITNAITIPTIGIGAGPHTDGQVLVLHDILGLSSNPPSFARSYASVRDIALGACTQFVHAVHERQWPDSQHSFD